jgi:hypothetical protein
MTDLADLETCEQNRILELFDSVVLLLKSDLAQWMDQDTLGHLSQMRDVVEAWVQGSSELTHEQMLTTIANLTTSLSRERLILLDESNKTIHY